MNWSTEKTEIRRYGFYANKKDLEKDGLGVIVMEIDGDSIKGLLIRIGKIENIIVPKEKFETLVAYDVYEFTELIPKTVWKKLKKIAK